MKLPKQFWVDLVSTTNFLLVRIPSRILNGDIPYDFLFSNKPIFSLESRVFDNYYPMNPKMMNYDFL